MFFKLVHILYRGLISQVVNFSFLSRLYRRFLNSRQTINNEICFFQFNKYVLMVSWMFRGCFDTTNIGKISTANYFSCTVYENYNLYQTFNYLPKYFLSGDGKTYRDHGFLHFLYTLFSKWIEINLHLCLVSCVYPELQHAPNFVVLPLIERQKCDPNWTEYCTTQFITENLTWTIPHSPPPLPLMNNVI
jgi:hypothetical protein